MDLDFGFGSGGSASSGVLLQFPTPDQYTSYRAGDVGDRAQIGWFNYIPPTNPKVIAKLDYSLGANYWARLTENIAVGGVANKLRFVDVDGGQTFSATGNKDLITIDKFSGLGMTRTNIGNAANWNAAIDNALSHSIIVNGVTYNDFYLRSALESILLFRLGTTTETMIDPISGAILSNASAGSSMAFTSTTIQLSTTIAHNHERMNFLKPENKTLAGRQIFIFNATSLITAP